MSVYYQTGHGKLYHGDCADIMPMLGRFDLTMTDPPYGIGEAAGKNKSRGKIAVAKDYGNLAWDNRTPGKKVFDVMRDISEYQIIFGGNYFVECLSNSSCWIVWDKLNGNSDFADCELAWTNFKSAVRKYDYRWAGMLQESMGRNREKRYHPTQKPVGLFVQILNRYAQKGWRVLDPFAGSGTTGLACERIGKLEYVLIEREEAYCEIIAKRLEDETAQLKLF